MRIVRRWGLFVALVLAGCASAKVVQLEQEPKAPLTAPSVVYVEDFDLGSTRLQSDPGLLARISDRRPHLFDREPSDPVQKLKFLSNRLSEQLVKQLDTEGFAAQRLGNGAPLPGNGWLLGGSMLEVTEGNRLMRSVIGFGTGQDHAQLYVTLTDLSQTQRPGIMNFDVNSDSGKMPGAIVTLNPYAAAARFVLARFDSERDIDRAAKAIVQAIDTYAKNHGVAPVK